MHAKMTVAVPILKISGNTSQRFCVLRDGSGMRIVAFQVIVKRLSHQVARLHLQWTKARSSTRGDSQVLVRGPEYRRHLFQQRWELPVLRSALRMQGFGDGSFYDPQ